MIDPGVIETGTSRHGGVVGNGAEFGKNAVELVEVVEKIEEIDCNPFFRIDVFRDRRDGFERAFDERGGYERVAEIERLVGGSEAETGGGGWGGRGARET